MRFISNLVEGVFAMGRGQKPVGSGIFTPHPGFPLSMKWRLLETIFYPLIEGRTKNAFAFRL